MPFRIEGWIEVCRGNNPDDENAWFGIIDVGPLVDTPDTISDQLFGLSQRFVNGGRPTESLAANRRLPRNPSAAVKEAIDRIQLHEAKFGTGQFGGYTHASWAEIGKFPIRPADLNQSDWYMVFDLVRCLEQYVPADRIRFTLWFSW
jgi:hypothetical protein